MIITKKLLTSDNPQSYFQLYTQQKTRGYLLKLFQKRIRIHTVNQFSSHRIVSYWNSLTNEIATTTTTNVFKSGVDHNWHLQIITMEDKVGCLQFESLPLLTSAIIGFILAAGQLHLRYSNDIVFSSMERSSVMKMKHSESDLRLKLCLLKVFDNV